MNSSGIELAAYAVAACLLASVAYASYVRPTRFIRNPLRRRQAWAVWIGLEFLLADMALSPMQSLGWLTLDAGILSWLHSALFLLGFMALVIASLIGPQ